MKIFDVYPLNDVTVVKAKGSFVYDDKDVEYLDMYGGHAVISIGHTHPHYVKRIDEQLAKIAFYSNSVHLPIQQELADKLGKLSGKNEYQLFFCNSGAEANENAMKLASFITGKKKIIAFKKSFHGRTSLAVAATDNPSIVAPINETDNILFLPFNDESALQSAFEQNDISAVIVEGIQGVGGIIEATNSFLQAIRTFCTKHKAIFIADEVQCGYGRSGKFFAHDHASVQADIYTMAKGMGNGFPIGGILIAGHIPAKHGLLGTTFGGNPLACAAGLAVLEVIEKENLINNALQTGNYLINELKQLNKLENVRGKGLMIGFDVPDALKELRKKLLYDFKVFTGEAKHNVIRLLPSLAISKNEAGIFLQRLNDCLKKF
jgi:acetylornithine/N-succinyldiaminopimelate aminotransferase